MFFVVSDYLPLFIFLVISVIVVCGLVVLPFFLSEKNGYTDKLLAYECGFNSLDDARMPFDVRFYLVSLLFIIFDLEIIFLVPWALSYQEIGFFGFFSGLVFIFIITVGFIYEWKKGALEWI